MYRCNASLLKRSKYHYGRVTISSDSILFVKPNGVETKITMQNINFCTLKKGWFLFSDTVTVTTKRGKGYIFKVFDGSRFKKAIESNLHSCTINSIAFDN